MFVAPTISGRNNRKGKSQRAPHDTSRLINIALPREVAKNDYIDIMDAFENKPSELVSLPQTRNR